jgi:hypothetical protein
MTLFLDRLEGKPRVNARTSEKQKLLHSEIETGRNQIVLDLQILEEKFDRKIVIGLNATDSRCRHNNGIGSVCRKKLPNALGVAQIQFTMCPNDDTPVAVLLKVSKQGTPYQTPVAGGGAQLLLQADPETVAEEGHQDVGFNPSLKPVKDRPQAQLAFECAKHGFKVGQLDVLPPEQLRIAIG